MTLRRRVRKLILIVHLTVSVGWIGAVGAYIPFDITAATSQDSETLRTAYIAMALIASNVLVPLALATVSTGLVISLGTRWGLLQHYWVLISFLLTVAATVVLWLQTTGAISYFAAVATDPTTSAADVQTLGNTLGHSLGGTVVLLMILVLNVYKPSGLTRYGWRKQHEQRDPRTRTDAARSGR